MTGPYPPPQQPGPNDGSWQQQQPWQQPGPPQDPTAPSYDLYPQQGGWPDAAPASGVPAPQQPAYGPPPPAYGPTSGAPAYPQPGMPQYGQQPGQFGPPAPMPPQNNSGKGWIFGGIAVAAVVVLIVIGVIVVNSMKGDSGSDNGGNSANGGGDSGNSTPAAKYKAVPDLCATFTSSDYSAVLGPSGTADSSSSDYSYSKNMTCVQQLEGNEYDLGTLDAEAAVYEDKSEVGSDFDSNVSAYGSTGKVSDLPGYGERAKIIFDNQIIPSVYLIVQDDNLVVNVRISTTEDTISNTKLQTAAEAVIKNMMAGLKA